MIMTTGDSIDAGDIPEGGVIRGDLPVPRRDRRGQRQRLGAVAGCRRRRCTSSRPAPSAPTWCRKLRENGWNISKTAEVIDTPRSNLYKKLEQYQISQETDG